MNLVPRRKYLSWRGEPGDPGLPGLPPFRCERPLRNLLNDSRKLFLKLLRLEIGVSPAPASEN